MEGVALLRTWLRWRSYNVGAARQIMNVCACADVYVRDNIRNAIRFCLSARGSAVYLLFT